MEELRSFDGKPDNDNAPVHVGDRVVITDAKQLELVEKYLGSGPYKLARLTPNVAHVVLEREYRDGMNVPLRPEDIVKSNTQSYGVPRATVRAAPSDQDSSV